MSDEWIKQNIECCYCGDSLKTSKYINLVQTGKKATWKYPTAGNVLLGKPPIEAVAILCDNCIDQKKKPLFAVEWNNEHTQIEYHPLASLEDLE